MPVAELNISFEFKETWRAMEEILESGKVRLRDELLVCNALMAHSMMLLWIFAAWKVHHIGVSNFTVEQLRELMSDCKYKPVVNQVWYAL